MLVLSRKRDEEIIVGDNIKIKILQIRGNTVRIGIEAPGEVSVMRGELVKEISPQTGDQSLTVEFKNTRLDATEQSPRLRVVAENTDPEPEPNKPLLMGTHRLHGMIAKMTEQK